MNLLDFSVTPIWRVWEAVEAAAAEHGVALRESELIGLAPIAALTDVADHVDVAATLPDIERITRAADWLTHSRLRSLDGARAPSRRGRASRHVTDPPGLLVHNAAEIVDTSPAACAAEPRRRTSASSRETMPSPRTKGESLRWAGSQTSSGSSRRWASPRRLARAARRATRHGHAGPDRSAHAPAVRGHAPGRGRAAPARPLVPGDPGRRRRHPPDGTRDARRARRGPAHRMRGAGSPRWRATA